jgi:aspartate racemase
MRTLGLLGGVTWRTSAAYYQLINEGVAAALGPYRSSDLLMRSLDYGAVRDARAGGDWRPLRRLVVDGCRQLKRAGAEGLVLCSNSLHGVAQAVESELGLPLLHIADVLADAALAEGHETVAFFGTRFTMSAPFYRKRLAARGVTMLTPRDGGGVGANEAIDTIIMSELAQGVVTEHSRKVFLDALAPLVDQGATAMVLGCTEIGMLIKSAQVPVLDTLALHAAAAARWQLNASPSAGG